MNDTAFILQSCTRAIAGAEEAVHLLEQKSRLEQAVASSDPALTLDTAKSLLESILKTILSDRINGPQLNKDLSPLYSDVRGVLTLNNNAQANEILKRLTNSIVHNVAELRNKYGAASHGDDGYFENPIEMPEAEMVAHIVDGMGGFLFRKHKNLNDPELSQRIFYSDYEEFNEWLDTQNDAIKLPVEEAKDIPFSVFLFTYDVTTYRAMLLQYLATENEDSEATTEIQQAVSAAEPAAEPAAEGKIDKIQILMDMLILNDEVRASVTDDECRNMALFVEDYAINKAGVDWDSRDSLISKFRIQIKRQLTKITYSEAFIESAIENLIDKAKELYPSEN